MALYFEYWMMIFLPKNLANDIANRDMDLFQLLKLGKQQNLIIKKSPNFRRTQKTANTALLESNNKSEFEKSNEIIAVSNENKKNNVKGDKQDNIKGNETEKDNANGNETEEGKFIPTATKEQFVSSNI